MAPIPAPLLSRIILVILTLSVAVVQMTASTTLSYGYDEAWHLYLSTVSPLWKALEEMAVDPHPPLYYFLLRPLISLGPEPFWPRLLSAVPTVLIVPLWYALLRKLGIARGIALTLTVVLAVSHSFNELGVTVRAYNMAALCLVGALWFWSDFLPGVRARPSRRSLRAFLVLSAAAFWFAYYAVFFTTALVAATLIASLIGHDIRGVLSRIWRDWFRWPERIAFVVAHAIGGAWFLAGYGRAGLAAPPHVSEFVYRGDRSVWSFVLDGLRGYLELFTPLAELGESVANIGLLVLGLGQVLLVWAMLRRGDGGRLVLILVPPLTVLILALTGIVGLYPFGGLLRHQSLLFPYILLVLAIALDPIYRAVSHGTLRVLACTLVLAIALWTSVRAWHSDPIGEPDRIQDCVAEIRTAFGAEADLLPVYLTVHPFYPIYTARLEQGIEYVDSYGHQDGDWVSIRALPRWTSSLGIRREWDEFRVVADSGKRVTLFRDRLLFRFPADPGEAFFERLHELMEMRGLKRLRMLSLHYDLPLPDDQMDLATQFGDHGFSLSEHRWSETGAVWLLERQRR